MTTSTAAETQNMSLAPFLDTLAPPMLLQVHNALATETVKKFASPEEAKAKTLAVLDANGYKTEADRDRLVEDLKKAGVHALPADKRDDDKPKKEKKAKTKKAPAQAPAAAPASPPAPEQSALPLPPGTPPAAEASTQPAPVAAQAPATPPASPVPVPAVASTPAAPQVAPATGAAKCSSCGGELGDRAKICRTCSPGVDGPKLTAVPPKTDLPVPEIPPGFPEDAAEIMRTTEVLDASTKPARWRRPTPEEALREASENDRKAADRTARARSAAETRKAPKSTRLTKLDATTLGHVQELVAASGKDEECHTDALAKSLEVPHDQAIVLVRQLAEKGYVTMEDDSAKPTEKLFIVKLTELGKATKGEKEGKVPGDKPGPRSKFTGKRIFRLVKENPRKPGSHGWKGFNLYEDGATYESFREKGGRNNDLQWDIDHKFVELRDA